MLSPAMFSYSDISTEHTDRVNQGWSRAQKGRELRACAMYDSSDLNSMELKLGEKEVAS